MAKAGLGHLHKDIAEYGRRLIRAGWDELEWDQLGNPRYRWPESGAVLTLPRNAYGRWRTEAEKRVATITRQRQNHRSTRSGAKRLHVVRDGDSIRAEQDRVDAATERNLSEAKRKRLIAEERRFNEFRRLMSAPPGRW